MQLTRAVLTIALAASAASALPRRNPGDHGNAQDRQQATLEATLDGIDKRSHISAYPHLKLGFGVGAGTEGESGLNQNTRKETMGQLESVGAIEVKSSDNAQNTDRLFSNAGKEAGRTIDGVMTFELPDSTESSAFEKKPLVQQASSEQELHGIIGMSNNADVPVSDTNAFQVMSAKMHAAMQTRGADQAKPSETNTGFTLNVHELISSLVQSQKQRQAELDKQPQQSQRQGSEHSNGIRQNRGHGEIFSGNLNAIPMSQQPDSSTDQRQGFDENSTAISDIEDHKDMSQQVSQMPLSQLEHSNREAASVLFQQNLANNQKQTMDYYGEQQMQQNQQQM